MTELIKINENDIVPFKPEDSALNEIIFDIRFECSSILKNPMKWEVDFVASLHEYDQVLASTLVGPISVGINRFALRADPPKLDDLPSDEVKLAALLVKAFYNDQEFYRIGYMVAHDYPPDIPHDNLDIKQLNRYISVDEDFITRKKTQINWT